MTPLDAEVPPRGTEGIAAVLRRLYGHLSRRRRVQLALVIALMLAGAVAELLTISAVLPFLALIADPAKAGIIPFLPYVPALAGREGGDLLLSAALLFAAVALLTGVIRVVLTWASQKFVYRLGHDIGVEVYRRALYQPYSYHIAHNSSALIADTVKVQIIVGSMLLPFMHAATGLVIAVFILAGLVLIDAQAALLASAGFSALYLGVLVAAQRRLRRNSRIIATTQTERVKTIQEGLGGIRDVILGRVQPVYLKTFASVDSASCNAQAMNAFIGTAPRSVIEAAGMALIVFLAVLLSRGAGGFAAALPLLGALALGAQRILPLLQLVYYGWMQIASNRHNLLDVLEVIDRPVPPVASMGTAETAVPFEREIELEGVGFCYQADGPMVVREVNLKIARGSRLGIVGKTGSGKSTLMDLVMGLLVPTTGELRVDGAVLTPANLFRWQMRIAHVPQSIYLSDCSIAENIAFGIAPADIDRERLLEAARQAAIGDFIASLPGGYATVVGERGVRLSGGQRQRIGIARALYRRASVLVLDEATSALDRETEAEVLRTIAGLGRDLTVLVIAHRLSTVAACDRVVKLDNGRLVAMGTREEVVPAEPEPESSQPCTDSWPGVLLPDQPAVSTFT